jgi:type I restriction enzyme M protein
VIRSVGRFSCRRRFANDASEYKNYLLVMLFVKYVSDSWTEHYEQLQVQYGDDRERILRRLERERFVLPPDCRFDDVYTKRNDTNLGEVINKALEQIEEANTRCSSF